MSSLNIKGQLFSLDEPIVMGILNVTPDSFYEGSRVNSIEKILSKAEKMLQEGARILDVGGYSSRPGADHISEEEELRRIIEPIIQIKKEFPESILSIDTFRRKIAEVALDKGADIVNDISGGSLDESMFDLIIERNIPYIMMHMKGDPQTMKSLNQYDYLLKEVTSYFAEKIWKLETNGVNDIIIDPGFGFAKNREQNFHLLNHLDYLKHMEKPILAGLSRKSMIFKSLDISQDEALNGTTVLNVLALQKGASILRVHDVKPALEAIKLYQLTINN